MPEGHSLYRLARQLNHSFAGTQVAASSPQGRFSSGAESLDGQTLILAGSYGKHLFVALGHPTVAGQLIAEEEVEQSRWQELLQWPELSWLHVHLGIYGSWIFQGEQARGAIGAPRKNYGRDPQAEEGLRIRGEIKPPGPNVRLRFVNDEIAADLSGPTACEVVDVTQIRQILNRLGADPLNTPQRKQDFIEAVRARRRPVGSLIMDQSVAAGPGNIYRAEALFCCGISPYRLGSNTGRARLAKLWDTLGEMLREGVETGIIVTMRDTDRPREDDMDPEAQRFYVYHRTGQPCLYCGEPIKEALMENRRLFWCGSCQR